MAYRAGERLTNKRDGVTHDYTAKQGVEHAEIVLPEGVNADWARDRSELWNAAEFAEKRKDARVAREFEVALPHELSAEERLEATREMAQELADRYGAAVDFAIHAPHEASDVRNHHAHILMTTRQVGEAAVIASAQPTGADGPVVLFYDSAAPQLLELVCQRFPAVTFHHAPTPEALRRMLPDADILVGSKFPSDIWDSADRLRWIQATSSGVDSLLAARGHLRTCVVTNLRGVHGKLMADYAMAMVGALQWRLPLLQRRQHEHHWEQFTTQPLDGRRLTLVGTGAIGCAIAERASASGLRVTGVARRDTSMRAGFERLVPSSQLHIALGDADYIVLAVPATAETEGMIDTAAFASMKPGAALINMARADVVVEAALIDALTSGHLSSAVIDVFTQEPLPPGNPLWDVPNLIVTPHVSGFTHDYDQQTARIFGDNLDAFLSGKPMKGLVDLDAGY